MDKQTPNEQTPAKPHTLELGCAISLAILAVGTSILIRHASGFQIVITDELIGGAVMLVISFLCICFFPESTMRIERRQSKENILRSAFMASFYGALIGGLITTWDWLIRLPFSWAVGAPVGVILGLVEFCRRRRRQDS